MELPTQLKISSSKNFSYSYCGRLPCLKLKFSLLSLHRNIKLSGTVKTFLRYERAPEPNRIICTWGIILLWIILLKTEYQSVWKIYEPVLCTLCYNCTLLSKKVPSSSIQDISKREYESTSLKWYNRSLLYLGLIIPTYII